MGSRFLLTERPVRKAVREPMEQSGEPATTSKQSVQRSSLPLLCDLHFSVVNSSVSASLRHSKSNSHIRG